MEDQATVPDPVGAAVAAGIEAALVVKASDPDEIVPNYVRSFVGQEVKAVDESSRSVTHLITTGAIDRMGDIVEPAGAMLDNFERNPLVLANHDYRIESVIGKARDLKIGKGGIKATTVFRDTPLAEDAFKLTKEKLGGWSIGFLPTESHSVKDGSSAGCKSCKARWAEMTDGKAVGEYVSGAWARHYTAWDMLEYSSVAIPANQEIVNNMVARGLVSSERAGQFFTVTRSITPEPAKPAAPGPIAEAVEIHPSLVDLKAIARATSRNDRRFRYAEVGRAVRSCLEKFDE